MLSLQGMEVDGCKLPSIKPSGRQVPAEGKRAASCDALSPSNCCRRAHRHSILENLTAHASKNKLLDLLERLQCSESSIYSMGVLQFPRLFSLQAFIEIFGTGIFNLQNVVTWCFWGKADVEDHGTPGNP